MRGAGDSVREGSEVGNWRVVHSGSQVCLLAGAWRGSVAVGVRKEKHTWKQAFDAFLRRRTSSRPGGLEN